MIVTTYPDDSRRRITKFMLDVGLAQNVSDAPKGLTGDFVQYADDYLAKVARLQDEIGCAAVVEVV